MRANSEADGSVVLSWQEPADDTFAVVYSVHRKSGTRTWEKIGESLRPSYSDRPTSPGTYSYRITAADYENNISAPSSEVTATPAAAAATKPASGSAPPWVADRTNYAENVRQVHARGVGKVRPDVFLFAGDSLTAATVYTHTLGSWLARGLTVRQGVGTVTTQYGAANIKALPGWRQARVRRRDVRHQRHGASRVNPGCDAQHRRGSSTPASSSALSPSWPRFRPVDTTNATNRVRNNSTARSPNSDERNASP